MGAHGTMSGHTLISSESVGSGHPDKIADQISDTVLDACLAVDPYSRVACESCIAGDFALVFGEITSKATLGTAEITDIVKAVVRDSGYTDKRVGLDYRTMEIVNKVQEQSPDIKMGVDKEGAGDQGMMYGFACSETTELMPAPIHYAHRLMLRASELREQPGGRWMGPDGKCQVTVEYEQTRPVRIHTVVFSQQHSEDISQADIKNAVVQDIITPVLSESGLLDKNTLLLINPTGRFVLGGPCSDSGLTGRKIIADTYGGVGRHGGGAFSGKDPTKVDRSAAYITRKIAKNIVAAGLATRCEIQASYAIGVSEPVSMSLQTFGTETVNIDALHAAVHKVFDLSPAAIIEELNLRRPIYRPTATFGHFGRSQFPWEACNKVEALRRAL